MAPTLTQVCVVLLCLCCALPLMHSKQPQKVQFTTKKQDLKSAALKTKHPHRDNEDSKDQCENGFGGKRGQCCGCCTAQGPMGPPGPAGVQGIQGIQGVQGQAGGPGIPGFDGNEGPKGERGFKGSKGDSGNTIFRPAPPFPRVAFSVTMDNDMQRTAEYRVVKYNIILNNHGGGFSKDTGMFTCPTNGTYLIGFSAVSYHGQDVLLHLIRNGQRILSAFDNSGCSCCGKTSAKCAGSGQNIGVLNLYQGDQLWIELPDQHGIHNAPYHNYASFYGYLIFPN